jgi:hypothetical protein
MTEHEASRTLVKSPPELWAECSEAASLARHLGQFGDIRITRLEPETSVAWEGERASGTVRLEPSGWGTRVVLTARQAPGAQAPPPVHEEPQPEPEPLPQQPPEPDPDPEPMPPAAEVASTEPERGFIARLRAKLGGKRKEEEPATDVTPEPGPDEAPEAVHAVATPLVEAEPAAETPPTAAGTTPPPAHAEPAVDPTAALSAALDSLGQAHHRPFSRA